MLARLIPPILAFSLLASACGPGDDWAASQVITLRADFYGAEALLNVSQDTSAFSVAYAETGETQQGLTISDQSPLFAMTSDGLKAALAAYSPTNENAADRLPRLSFVAVSPIGDVFLVFEHSFIFRDVADDGTLIADYKDPWSSSSPFTCQIYLADVKIHDFNASHAENPPGFTCLTDSLEINVWDFRASLIQFDDAGNAFFSAHVPQNWKNVLIKYDAAARTLDEVINANICYRDFLITGSGGILYTGITSTNGDCNGDSFLRYRTPEGELQEITRGWWDYRFAPIEKGVHAGKILFYGPDPSSAETPQWDDACLYRFDPSAAGTDRAVQIVSCDVDTWGYIESAATVADKRDRCVETGPLLGGGNQPDQIFLSDSYGASAPGGGLTYGETDSVEEIFLVGDIYHKRAGDWRCNICVEPDASDPSQGHCVSPNGELTMVEDEASCTGTWYGANQTRCYNDSVGDVCSVALPSHFRKYAEWCQSPGNNWLESRSGLARVDEDEGGGSVALLSSDNEVVTHAWSLAGRLAYVAFNAEAGSYELREMQEGASRMLLSGIEVYELIVDPRDPDKWFLSGLRFEDNAYIIGTLDPETLTLDVETGVTGQIETIVIVPDP